MGTRDAVLSMATTTSMSTPRHRPSLRNISYTSPGMASRRGPIAAASSNAGGHEAAGDSNHNNNAGGNIEVGDVVDVPGGMDGTVKFVGEVRGKQGFFVGVELSKKWAARGKNDGDADGVRYFSTSIPGAGIFLPINRAVKRASPPGSLNSVPSTPTMPNMDNFNLSFSSHAEHTPAPAPKFSQSVSAARAQSPAFKSNNSRPSLPRPESPLRRPMNSSIANATTTPGRPSLNMLSNNRIPGPRYAASPAPGKPPTKAPGKPPSYTSPPPSARTTTQAPRPLSKDVISGSDDEVAQLRSLLAEKNEKIAALTAEFDGHRADFRNTLDSLELASAETDRVYEGRIDELLAERSDLLAHREGVETVAQQLEELQEVVVELEEGLEDARRGEAEARGEVEFLRGEVERVRAELRRERERNAEGGGYVVNGASPSAERMREREYVSRTSLEGARERERDHGSQQSGDLGRSFHSRARGSVSLRSNRDSNPSQVDERRREGVQQQPQHHHHQQQQPQDQQLLEPAGASEPMGSGEVADKWCALCEGDGHDSISCPYDKE